MLFGYVRATKAAVLRRLDGERRPAPARLPEALVRREEEEAIPHDRPAEAVAELLLRELGHGGLEHVLGREVLVLVVERRAAAERVGAALRDDLNLGAAVAAVHGREVVRHDADFLNRLGVRRQVGDAAAGHAVGARVVEGERVGLVALAARVDARRRFARERVVAVATRTEGGRHALAGHARLQRDQVVEVPAVERHLLQLRAVDAPGDAALGGFDQRRGPGHGHALGHAGHFENEVAARGFADADAHLVHAFLEPVEFDLDSVGPDGEADDGIEAVCRGDRLPRLSGGDVRDLDRGAGEHALLGIGHSALDCAVELRARGRWQEHEGHDQ